MTSEAEWRRTHADPAELRRQADELRRRAEQLSEPYQRLRSEVDRARWSGAAATRFRDETYQRYQQVMRARWALEEAANAMSSAAGRLEAELERVRREEREERERRGR